MSYWKVAKIVSLNIRHGGGKRQGALASWLVRTNPELLVLTQWRKGSAVLGAALASAGYRQSIAFHENIRANGVAMFSRENCLANRVTPRDIQCGTLVLSRAKGLTVLGAYFPQTQAKSVFFQRCAELAAKQTDPLLLIGDLNTGCNIRDFEQGVPDFTARVNSSI